MLFFHVNSDYHLGSLAFNLKDFLEYFWSWRLASKKFNQFFFIWECLYFASTFERQSSWLIAFFLGAHWMFSTVFWLPLLLLRIQLSILLGFPSKWKTVPLLLISRFLSPFVFQHLCHICLWIPFLFILLGVSWSP